MTFYFLGTKHSLAAKGGGICLESVSHSPPTLPPLSYQLSCCNQSSFFTCTAKGFCNWTQSTYSSSPSRSLRSLAVSVHHSFIYLSASLASQHVININELGICFCFLLFRSLSLSYPCACIPYTWPADGEGLTQVVDLYILPF